MKLGLPPIVDAERLPLIRCLLAIIDFLEQRPQEHEAMVQVLGDEFAVFGATA